MKTTRQNLSKTSRLVRPQTANSGDMRLNEFGADAAAYNQALRELGIPTK